jgi:anti-anti-sigma factor
MRQYRHERADALTLSSAEHRGRDDSQGTAAMNSPQFRPDDGPGTVVATGDIDLANVDAFRAVMDEAARQRPSIVVDMSQVTYCDSAGVRTLFSIAADTEMTLRIRAAGPLKKLLDISGLDRVTTVELVD